MEKALKVFLCLLMVILFVCPAFAAEKTHRAQVETLLKVTKELRKRVEELEKRLEKYEAKKQEIAEAKKEVAGLKEALGNLEFSANITLVTQASAGNDDNAERAGGEGKDTIDAAWSIDFDITSKIGDRGSGYILMEAGQGYGVNDEVNTLSGINDDAPETDSATVEVTEAWYEHAFSAVPVVGTLGKVDLTNYFDANEVANDETVQFLSSGFVNNMAVEFPDDNGLGARITYSPTEFLDLSAGWGEADADFEDIVDDGFGILEIGFKSELGGQPGNYRIYAWITGYNHFDTGDLKDVANGAKTFSDVDDNENNWGVGFSFDQSICKDVTVFLRGGVMDDDVLRYDKESKEAEGAPVEGALSGGFQVGGSYWGRNDDRFAVAFGTVFVDDELEGLYGLPCDIVDEHHLEIYYAVSLFEGGLEFSPDVQVIWNPGGDNDADTVFVGGVRMQVTL